MNSSLKNSSSFKSIKDSSYGNKKSQMLGFFKKCVNRVM